MGNVAGSWGWPKMQVCRTGVTSSFLSSLKAAGQPAFFFPTGVSSLQTVLVTLLGPRACGRLHAAPGGDGIPIVPGMVCTSVVGELPRCEVSPSSKC